MPDADYSLVMEYNLSDFAQLATALAEHEAFESWKCSRPERTIVDPRQQRLAKALKAEILSAAMLIATATSLANAIEKGGSGVPHPRALNVYMPAHAGSFTSAIDRLIAVDADAEVCEDLQMFAARLALAQRMSASLALDQGLDASAHHVDPEILADAWRRVCSAARQAIEALDQIDNVTSQGSALNRSRALSLLHLAEAGAQPCLDPDGRVTIPGWAERRREPRQDLRIEADAVIGGVTLAVIIRNASQSGLGLEMSRKAALGERLLVRVAGGRELTGEIAWADGIRAGMKLDQRLPTLDPLLAQTAAKRLAAAPVA